MKATHTTKFGFGELLGEGIKCRIVCQEIARRDKVLIELAKVNGKRITFDHGNKNYYHGSLNDLVELNPLN